MGKPFTSLHAFSQLRHPTQAVRSVSTPKLLGYPSNSVEARAFPVRPSRRVPPIAPTVPRKILRFMFRPASFAFFSSPATGLLLESSGFLSIRSLLCEFCYCTGESTSPSFPLWGSFAHDKARCSPPDLCRDHPCPCGTRSTSYGMPP